MDKDRQIRFLYPPFFLVFSILLALLIDNTRSIELIIPSLGTETKSIEIIAALIGGGIIVVILGFIIGTLSINIMRLLFLIFGEKHYEVVLPEITYDRIFSILKLDKDKKTDKQKFFSVVTFDHEIIPKGVHQWIVRRWNSFGVSINSVVALILSFPIIICLKIHINWIWIILILFACILFLINGIIAWKETMGMINFQSNCEQNLFIKNKNE